MVHPDYTEVRVGNDERCLIVYEREDPEQVAITVCMTALRDLDADAAARVAQYVADRHPAIATASSRERSPTKPPRASADSGKSATPPQFRNREAGS